MKYRKEPIIADGAGFAQDLRSSELWQVSSLLLDHAKHVPNRLFGAHSLIAESQRLTNG